MNALHVIIPLAFLYVVVLLATRHRREAVRKATFSRHLESVRLPESWLDRRERETRTLTGDDL